MKTVSGSILFLAAAIVLHPTVENPHRWDQPPVILFALPCVILGLILIIAGLRSKS